MKHENEMVRWWSAGRLRINTRVITCAGEYGSVVQTTIQSAHMHPGCAYIKMDTGDEKDHVRWIPIDDLNKAWGG